ncbi:hypothetical protein ES319_A03G113000v1 [Gossypium barbadense]|uniref:Uncharacterized protein n=2 Tax=Gossypium TaxID=3633 RepID=A0A5J5WFY4_GOSBA|nr:hypothetical protein ES319_A03G113000v1 [Gossypium barbadense]TYH24897.1 hypothetical protein ES288_A03G126600v1 [Gossypium darwinii]
MQEEKNKTKSVSALGGLLSRIPLRSAAGAMLLTCESWFSSSLVLTWIPSWFCSSITDFRSSSIIIEPIVDKKVIEVVN